MLDYLRKHLQYQGDYLRKNHQHQVGYSQGEGYLVIIKLIKDYFQWVSKQRKMMKGEVLFFYKILRKRRRIGGREITGNRPNPVNQQLPGSLTLRETLR